MVRDPGPRVVYKCVWRRDREPVRGRRFAHGWFAQPIGNAAVALVAKIGWISEVHFPSEKGK